MDDIDQPQLVRDGQGDPALLAPAAIDQAFPGIPGTERNALLSAFEVAAVPHWCDAGILMALIDDPAAPSAARWMRLKELPVIEPCPAGGAGAGKVPQTSRLAIRKRLAETQRGWFTELSARSARVFEADARPVGRIERIYHLLVADPERGATELADLSRSWDVTAREEDLTALSAALAELDASGVLQGRASVRSRLILAQRRADATGAAGLGDVAEELRRAAEATGDARLAGDAYLLVGDVARERGDLAVAAEAFGQSLAISQRLAALDPANASWQRDLAVAFNWMGTWRWSATTWPRRRRRSAGTWPSPGG